MKLARLLLLCLCVPLVRGSAPVQDLNTPRAFPLIESRQQWEERAAEIRLQALVSCGLWPMPSKTALNARVFDRVDRDGYTIEKVYFETYPGFFLAGNLYRPLGRGAGPFPGILNPHGHWKEGRMADVETGSIAARCIHFARQGMVAFSYDMIGYNDTAQVDHKFASNPASQLWNISLMGLQTWNSIRALDFLESLPDVDSERLACTGESGGGTQTFMLGAVDPRLALQAPIVMVSHSMQGGCLCENAPGLRLEYSNMEIAAVPAPRPQIIVAATGDWTKKTMEIEGPAIEKIYALFEAPERFHYAIFDYPHNYNKTTREEVYRWFSKWLLNDSGATSERSYKKEPDADLRVFPEGKFPPNALRREQVIPLLKGVYKNQLASARPRDASSLNHFKEAILTLWNNSLQLPPDAAPVEPARATAGQDAKTIVLVDSQSRPPEELKEGRTLVAVAWDGITAAEDQFGNYFTTYNRTLLQAKALRIHETCEKLRAKHPGARLIFYADAESSPAFMLAAPLADALIADGSGVDESSDEALLGPEIFFPGYRRMGGIQAALALAAPRPVLLQGHSRIGTDWLQPLYDSLNAGRRLKLSVEPLEAGQIAAWLESQNL